MSNIFSRCILQHLQDRIVNDLHILGTNKQPVFSFYLFDLQLQVFFLEPITIQNLTHDLSAQSYQKSELEIEKLSFSIKKTPR